MIWKVGTDREEKSFHENLGSDQEKQWGLLQGAQNQAQLSESQSEDFDEWKLTSMFLRLHDPNLLNFSEEQG